LLQLPVVALVYKSGLQHGRRAALYANLVEQETDFKLRAAALATLLE